MFRDLRRRRSRLVLWAMRNSQPSRLSTAGALGSCAQRLDEGILQDILAIDRRSRHARAVAMKAWPERVQTILEFVRAHVSRPTALPRWSAKDWTDMSRRIFDKAAGCDRKGEWLLSNVCVIVVPPMVPSTAAIM